MCRLTEPHIAAAAGTEEFIYKILDLRLPELDVTTDLDECGPITKVGVNGCAV